MKLVTKIAAGVLLGFGLPITLVAAVELLNPKTVPDDRSAMAAALIFFGLPPTALSSYLIWNGYSQRQQEERDRLRATFFRLLQEGQGRITALKFAMETGLEGGQAKLYLDERAKEFNAGFDVSEEGRLSYFFDLGDVSPAVLSAASVVETFDVILEFVPSQCRREVVKAVRDITGLSWSEAKALMKQQLPAPVIQGVDKNTAETFRRQLEMAGAKVIVVLK